MPRTKSDAHLFDLAKRGAESRVRELINELKLLTSAFPHLRDSFDRDELPVNFILRQGRETGARRAIRRRAAWTAAQRKAVSARMKKYWAKRKRAEK